MIDFGAIQVMFKSEYVTECSQTYNLNPDVKKQLGLTYSGQIDFDEHGKPEISRLTHRFESIPSSFASLAFLFVDGTDFNCYPYIRICGNPAKLLQGHNVYGSDNADLCLFSLVEAFILAMPELANYLDWPTAKLDYIDITYSARVVNENTALQVLNVLKNVSSGQTKNKMTDDYLTTVYWGKSSGKNTRSSRRKQLKAYLKGPELQNAIKEVQKRLLKSKGDEILTNCLTNQLNALTDPQVQRMAANAIRFEGRLFAQWLFDNGMPTNLLDFINRCIADKNLLKNLWKKSWNDVFSSFKGAKMHLHNDTDIHNSLKEHFYRETSKGRTYAKANRLFDFYNSIKTRGFETVYRNSDRATFGRYLADLTVAGVSRAHLQNLKSDLSNVVPLIRFVNVDFENQHPDNWVEPQPLHQQMKLKLVS